MNREGSIARTLLFLLYGPIVWAADFLVVYGSHAAYCAAGDRLAGDAETMIAVVQWSATIAAGLLLAGGILWPSAVRGAFRAVPAQSSEAGFAVKVMQLLALLSLFGIVFAAAAIVLLPACGQLR